MLFVWNVVLNAGFETVENFVNVWVCVWKEGVVYDGGAKFCSNWEINLCCSDMSILPASISRRRLSFSRISCMDWARLTASAAVVVVVVVAGGVGVPFSGSVTSDLASESWWEELDGGACGENWEFESMSEMGLLETGCWIDSGDIGWLLKLAGDGLFSSKWDVGLGIKRMGLEVYFQWGKITSFVFIFNRRRAVFVWYFINVLTS